MAKHITHKESILIGAMAVLAIVCLVFLVFILVSPLPESVLYIKDGGEWVAQQELQTTHSPKFIFIPVAVLLCSLTIIFLCLAKSRKRIRNENGNVKES